MTNRKQGINIRKTNETKQKIRMKKTVYPDAPSPALLRVPLFFGYFLYNPRKCFQISRPVLPTCEERKTELAAVGDI